MEVVDPGHRYRLQVLDIPKGSSAQIPILQFVKREGVGYPGNVGTSPGCLLQEVFRVCIDRLNYLQGQHPCWENLVIKQLLRASIQMLENRTRKRREQDFILFGDEETEKELTCNVCGHIRCLEDHK